MFKPDASLTFRNASATLEAGLQAIADGQSTIDLSDVGNVDSSAVAILLTWQRAAGKQSATLHFGAMPVNLQSLIDLYGAGVLLGMPESASDRHR